MPFGIQPIHVVIVVVVGLVIFGPAKLPELGRGVGRALTEFRKGSQEMAESFREELGHGTPEATSAAAPLTDLRPSEPTLAVNTDAATAPTGRPTGYGDRCGSCATANPPASRFCSSCGAALPPVPNPS